MSKRDEAAVLNAQAMELHEAGRVKEAIRLYRRAARVDPRWAAPLYNLGLLFKNERAWKKSLEMNRRATAIDPGHQEAWWNLGIAATALGHWDVARQAWRGYGINLADGGEGPVECPCGFGPIRLNPRGDAEVVWAYRIDPARARLASIPFPESGHGWGDVVLNDGAPTGYRRHNGKRLPVLDALQVLERSPFGTYVAEVAVPRKLTATARLVQLAEELEGSAEDWSTSTRLLCRACSEGSPHEFHDTEAAPPEGVHLIGIAARGRSHAVQILAAWESCTKGVRVESLDDALKPGPDRDA
jgi:TPR repeat protein